MILNAVLTPVEPTSPVAPWMGGKRNLAKRICAILDQTPCGTYAEPFVGMGGVFLRLIELLDHYWRVVEFP